MLGYLKAAPLHWLRALKDTARSGLSVERASLTPLTAVRGACGVGLVVGLALLIGTPQLAVSSAFGAFASGIATFQRSWRPRPVLALAASTGLAVSTFLGYLLIGMPWAFVLLLALWAFLAGMAWGVGPTSGVVAAFNISVMLITVHLPTSTLGALNHAALIAMGGVVQAGLIVLFPVRPWGAHRDTLADALAAVADYARRLRHDPMAPFDPEPLIQARTAAAVTPRQARRRPRQLHGYRAMAERFRPVLASLADPVVGGAPMVGPERDRVRELLAAAATVLDASARAIRRGERVRLPDQALDVLQVPKSGPVLSGPARRAALRLIALTDDAVEAAQEPVEVTRGGVLARVTWHVADREGRRRGFPDQHPEADASLDGPYGPDPDEVAAEEAEARESENARRKAAGGKHTPAAGHALARHRHLHMPTLAGLVPVALRALRREFHWKSLILRHALRVSAVVSVGFLIGRALPPAHGYWVPLTAVMVLRPDFSRTYERGIGRAVGTFVGVAIAGTVMALAGPGPYLSAGLAVLSVGFLYLLLSTGYVIASVCTGAYVIFLLGILGTDWYQTAYERAGLTALGGLLAMLSYALFPAWHTPLLRDRLADWLAATGRYAIAVLDAFAQPAAHAPRQVREALLDTRAARQDWEQTLSRAEAEPVRHRGRLSRRSASDAQSALVTMGRACMLLEAHLPGPDARPDGAAADFSAAVATDMSAAVTAVRESEPLEWKRVHQALARWWEEADQPPPVALRTAELLTDALDDLTHAAAPKKS
ncbi:FUSC family protein [Streptomyces qinglanensis]|uniref:FUSC-like inner membrane protein yccS n=1 Tax=Streptomyces qinglanensis TaxID=943816 RepID=A0A1H9UFM1_9ACTN|nr:FUSC family protein [Streptomyces qinglanensis]SES08068.1 FUSC-like inner membrane protein yccS [Streptomyces qinglanensis]